MSAGVGLGEEGVNRRPHLSNGGIGFAVYTLYKNVWPVPPYPFEIFPYVVAGWLAIGLAAAFLVPGFASRVHSALESRTESADETPAAIPALQL